MTNTATTTKEERQAIAFAAEILQRLTKGIELPYPGAQEHALSGLSALLGEKG